MANSINRRKFLKTAAVGCAAGFCGLGLLSRSAEARHGPVISPGCRRSYLRVAKIYMGKPGAHWPTPKLDLQTEIQRYENEFARRTKEFGDVKFLGNALVTAPEQVDNLKDAIQQADGVLVIHLSMGAFEILQRICAAGKPTMLFAAPYSGHEWTRFGALRKDPAGALLDCILDDDMDQLGVAIRPFRAIHHLRKAKIVNVTTRAPSAAYVQSIKDKFGTQIVVIGKEPVLEAYNAVPDAQAREETDRWIAGAEKIVEPSEDEIFRSCKLALALEKVLNDLDGTVMTVDCYGSMYKQLPAFPCISHTRMNDMGLGGICESDLRCAMTHIIFQGLSGRPGFVSDPTMDGENIILAHCMGTRRMDGPDGEAAPYKLRCVMERQAGAVAQVRMRKGQKVTQAILTDPNQIVYFTGDIVDAPDIDRGCRTKITVRVDGDAQKLWQNWGYGLHRQTCYGDLTEDLKRFCRFKNITLVNEAV